MKLLKTILCFVLLGPFMSAQAQNWDIRLLDRLNSAPQAQDKILAIYFKQLGQNRCSRTHRAFYCWIHKTRCNN